MSFAILSLLADGTFRVRSSGQAVVKFLRAFAGEITNANSPIPQVRPVAEWTIAWKRWRARAEATPRSDKHKARLLSTPRAPHAAFVRKGIGDDKQFTHR